jgi:multidrug resistance efflux pump
VAFLTAEKEGNVPALDSTLVEMDSKNSLDLRLANAQKQLATAEKKLIAMRTDFEQAQKTLRFVNMSLLSKPKISNATHLLLQLVEKHLARILRLDQNSIFRGIIILPFVRP